MNLVNKIAKHVESITKFNFVFHEQDTENLLNIDEDVFNIPYYMLQSETLMDTIEKVAKHKVYT